MFAGLVEVLGQVVAVKATNQGVQLEIHLPQQFMPEKVGASIAINGVCLTVIEQTSERIWVEVSKNTLMVTTLNELNAGDKVHVERSLTFGAPIHGHLVAGHVDTVTRLEAIEEEGDSQRWIFSAPAAIRSYIAEKGSVCVHGVSLTVASVNDKSFTVVLIPHTLKVTVFNSAAVGMIYNIEADLLARYCARILDCSNHLFTAASNEVNSVASLYDTTIMKGQQS